MYINSKPHTANASSVRKQTVSGETHEHTKTVFIHKVLTAFPSLHAKVQAQQKSALTTISFVVAE